jgi:hypothetical protein
MGERGSYDYFPPGSVIVNWERREIRVRGPLADYWHDSRYPSLGMVRLRDDAVAGWLASGEYELVTPGWHLAPGLRDDTWRD